MTRPPAFTDDQLADLHIYERDFYHYMRGIAAYAEEARRSLELARQARRLQAMDPARGKRALQSVDFALEDIEGMSVDALSDLEWLIDDLIRQREGREAA